MGASGVGLFHDDVAVDVRRHYLDLLASGASDADAFRTMLLEWKESIADVDDGPVFWVALASTQWEYGRLHPRAKTAALKVIEQGQGSDRWAEAGLVRKRQAVLARLQEKLLSPLPKKRTPRSRRRALPEMLSTSLAAPDGNAEATAWQFETIPKTQVYVTMKVNRSEGGGSVFVASCDVADVKMSWLDANTLRITYPKEAEIRRQAATSFYSGRTITVNYRSV